MRTEVPLDHPRYESLVVRERIIEGMHNNVVAEAGLIAHGRGEAFDYILGESTPGIVLEQERLAVITMLLAESPIISVNGNVAALCADGIVKLSKVLRAPLEINLFYRSKERLQAIEKTLFDAGAGEIYGTDPRYHTTISEITHKRRIVDSRGIKMSDCVLVPLEDGDRAEALRRMGKTVVTVDLNPLSRTSVAASVTITNNIIRAVEEMADIAIDYSDKSQLELLELKSSLNNESLLRKVLKLMSNRLSTIAEDAEPFTIHEVK
ncbi:MAG: phosphopantothenate/pantothenate synthetase [Candidatus Heimdallarchaeota archaeon]